MNKGFVMENIIKCPSCKGKGHVFDSFTLLNPVFWPFGFFETNNKNGCTREQCPQCKGSGFIKVKPHEDME